MPETIELAGSKSRGMLLLTRETHFRRCYKPNLTFDTCRGTLESFTAIDRGFQKQKDVNLTFLDEKVTSPYLFVLKSGELLLLRTEKRQIFTFSREVK